MIRRSRVFGLVLLALATAPAHADIFGYVDENGTSHFSDIKLDSRYKLYMKARPAAVAPQASPETASIPAGAAVAVLKQPKGLKHYADLIAQVASELNVEPALLHAVVAVESAYNPLAKSRKGATGLMQLMPDTAKRYGVTDRTDPLDNLRGGARYLRDLMATFDNNLRLVIAAYNAGEAAVMRSGNRIPPYAETRAYVPRVLRYYESYRARSAS